MSFLGRIKSAVMGNPVTREYEIGRHVASAGPGLMWRVHSGVKRSTRQEVSVFVFNKQSPEFEKLPKKQREAIIEMLKKGPTHLVKLRHPRLLTINHPVEESSDCLAFATEPVFASLANILGHYDNLPSPLPLIIKEYELYPIEIQCGLLQVAEALDFLHSDVKLMHGNLVPEAVVINAHGAWKLMGFNFCCYSHYQSEAQMSFQFREWDTRRPRHTNPSLDYLAPEYILSKSCSEASDVYSYGMLVYAAYNQGKPLYENQNNMLAFKQSVEQISRVTEPMLGQVPQDFKSLIRTCFSVEPSVRPDALQITKHAFFEEVGVSTLKYLDMLYERGDMEKSQFFKKNLSRVITKIPKRVVHKQVLPALTEEFRNHKMIPFVLPLVLLVADDCNMQEYNTLILPMLIPALQVQDPIQVPLIFLQKMDLLLKLTSPDDVKKHILPMIITSLEAEHSQLQELCVSILPSFANMVDYSSMKHSIVPRLTALCIGSKSIPLQVKCLVSLGQMLDILDKHIVLDHILPILAQVPSREPGVLMAILGIYHQTLINKKLGLDKLMLATRIVPFLIPLSIEPTLNLQQFHQFMRVIREMLQKVETEQETHLRQLAQMEEQTKSTVEFAREVAEVKAMEDSINRLEGMFGGSGSHETLTSPRRGTAVVTGTAPPAKTASNEAADLLGGLMVGDSTTPPLTSTPPNMIAARNKPLQPTPQEKPSPKLGHSQSPQPTVMKSTPASHVLQPEVTKQTRNASTGYVPPLQPQKTAPTVTSANMGWSSGMATSSSVATPTDLSGMIPRSSSGSPSLFSGMQMNAQAPIQQTNVQSSMITSSSGLSPLVPTPATQRSGMGSSWSTNIQPQSSQPLVPTPATQHSGMGGSWSVNIQPQSSQPLVPTPATQHSGMGGSWSANIQPQSSQPLVPTQMHQQSGTGGGWSGNTQPQSSQPLLPTQPRSGTGDSWSANIQPQSLMHSQQGGTGSSWSTNIQPIGSQQGHLLGQQQMGGWSSSIAPGVGSLQNHGGMSWSTDTRGGMSTYSSGMGMQNQPTAASVLMSGGQPLLPQSSTQQQPFQQQQQQMAATGANPFSDLSFLS